MAAGLVSDCSRIAITPFSGIDNVLVTAPGGEA
jgi:hypothetical protein